MFDFMDLYSGVIELKVGFILKVLICRNLASQMFPTMFNPEKSTSLLNVTVRSIRSPSPLLRKGSWQTRLNLRRIKL